MRRSGLVLMLMGCASKGDALGAGFDTDGDGLSDAAELALGTDPLAPDTDADLLDDGREAAVGADPLNPDTDGDGYLDGWEVREGSDPADPESRIYAGGWPYNPDKDALEDPGLAGTVHDGGRLPRLQLMDQYGDMVDLYDFANQGRPIVLDVSAAWCGPCKEVAAWSAGEETWLDEYVLEEPWVYSLPESLAAGDILWVTIISETNDHSTPVDQETLQTWAAQHPGAPIAVLGDDDYALRTWLDGTGYPAIALFDSEWMVVEYDRLDWMVALRAAPAAVAASVP